MSAVNYLKEKYGHKVGRNETCPCGSGKKYKYCCLEKDKQPAIKEEIKPAKKKTTRKTKVKENE